MNKIILLIGLILANHVTAEVFYIKISGTIIGSACPIRHSNDIKPSVKQASYNSDCVPNDTKIEPIYEVEQMSGVENKTHIGNVLVVTYH